MADRADASWQLKLDAQTLIYGWDGLMGPDAGTLADQLYGQLPWCQPNISLFGRSHPIPRLQSWHGEAEARYRYSGLPLKPEPWSPALRAIRERVTAVTGLTFNSVLANLYRDGQDSMGWHADDEEELGPRPWIASYSLGAARTFSFRAKGQGKTSHRMDLLHDQLILMSPEVQARYQHALPKRMRCQSWRINLTFRNVTTAHGKDG